MSRLWLEVPHSTLNVRVRSPFGFLWIWNQRARHEGDEMARCFGEGHRAYEEGDGARAKELSNQGKRHKAEMERLNKEASDWVFYRKHGRILWNLCLYLSLRTALHSENNTDSAPDEVDLHGLYVAEAIERTENAIQQAHSAGRDHLNIIVGKVGSVAW